MSGNNFKNFIARLTYGHKILGLGCAALLFLICMTGTLSVFYTELERWEKIDIPEASNFADISIAKATAEALVVMRADKKREPIYEDLYVSIPNPDFPRLTAGYDEDARAYDTAGNYIGKASHDITHFVTELHYYLHLPETFGMIFVSIMGIFMLSLLVGGALSHKRMFRDAFDLRSREKGHLSKADIHNRIGTWTLPFTIMVTATGSFVGFSQVVVFLMATFFHHGDIGKAMAPMLGSPEEISLATKDKPYNGEAAIINALNNMRKERPDETPLYMAIKKAVTPSPYIEITTKVPERLIFGEAYVFDANGNLAKTHGLKDAEAGKVIYASLFPLHFGSFGGYPVKIMYFVLGAILCLMINAGMEIWFTKSAAKGKPRPHLHITWVSFVYSSISTLFIAASAKLLFGANMDIIYWSGLVGFVIISNLIAKMINYDIHKLGHMHRTILGISIISLAASHQAVFNSNTKLAIIFNSILIISGILILLSVRFKIPFPIKKQLKTI